MPQPKKSPQVHESVEANERELERRDPDAPDETPGGFQPDDARASVVEGKSVEAPIGDPLSGLTREELVRLQSAVDGALTGWGVEPGEDGPAARGPSIKEQASVLPVSAKHSEDCSRADAAKALDLEEHEVLRAVVRQEGADSNNKDKDTGFGPKYLSAVLADGRKVAVKL